MREGTEDLVIKCGLLTGMFVFLVLGVLALDRDPDFIFDRFLSAGFFLFFFFFYKKMGLRSLVLVIGVFALVLHHLKLYGNVYYGIPFDKIMHVIGGFALALILYQYLSSCEGVGCSSRVKLMAFAILGVAGLGTFIEITEYFGYAHLGNGEGLLFHGLGDGGSASLSDWADSVTDMMSNLLGAMMGAAVMVLAHFMKRRNVKKLRLFLISLV